MERFEAGMLAKSIAGHDKGHVYVIYKEETAYVYLVDGDLKTIQKPKKKKKKHVQVIQKKHELDGIDDVGMKRILKLYGKQSQTLMSEQGGN